jgi:hypothetical protein
MVSEPVRRAAILPIAGDTMIVAKQLNASVRQAARKGVLLLKK